MRDYTRKLEDAETTCTPATSTTDSDVKDSETRSEKNKMFLLTDSTNSDSKTWDFFFKFEIILIFFCLLSDTTNINNSDFEALDENAKDLLALMKALEKVYPKDRILRQAVSMTQLLTNNSKSLFKKLWTAPPDNCKQFENNRTFVIKHLPDADSSLKVSPSNGIF